jgi:hypothetical protein
MWLRAKSLMEKAEGARREDSKIKAIDKKLSELEK